MTLEDLIPEAFSLYETDLQKATTYYNQKKYKEFNELLIGRINLVGDIDYELYSVEEAFAVIQEQFAKLKTLVITDKIKEAITSMDPTRLSEGNPLKLLSEVFDDENYMNFKAEAKTAAKLMDDFEYLVALYNSGERLVLCVDMTGDFSLTPFSYRSQEDVAKALNEIPRLSIDQGQERE